MTEEEIFKRYGQPLTIPIPEGDLKSALLTLAEAAPSAWAYLDRRIREVSPYRRSDQPLWPQISAVELERILRTPEPATHLLGLVSFHQSGYIRELAVRRLSQVNSGKELPFLLLRLNDWVAPVSKAASDAVQARLVPERAGAFVDSLALVFDLMEQKRRSHGALASAVTTLLKRPECDPALQRGMVSADRNIRRLCLRLLEEADDERLAEAVRQGTGDVDQTTRFAAARIARTKSDNDALRALLPLMRQDRSVAVRREAFYACLERLPDLIQADLFTVLPDVNGTMREAARYYLQKSADFDVPGFYRQALAVSVLPSELGAAISGLGETGIAPDVGLILPYLSHPLAKVRRLAVKAVDGMDGDNQTDALLSALADERPSVTHAAREALRPRLALLDSEALWRLFQAAARPHVRRDVLALLASLPKWDRVLYLVSAAVDEDPVIQERVAEYLRAWSSGYNLSFVRPTLMQLTRLEKALRVNPVPKLVALADELKARGTT